jgi:hypothetical protein
MDAIPEALVVEVAEAKDPLALLLVHVTVLSAVGTAFPLTSASCAEIVTLPPTNGVFEDDVTRYLVSGPGVIVIAPDVTGIATLTGRK